jgi:hypothetical protein
MCVHRTVLSLLTGTFFAAASAVSGIAQLIPPEVDWEWGYGEGGEEDDAINSVLETSDGQYIAVGYTLSLGAGGSDVFLVKVDGQGHSVWQKTYGGASSDVGNCVRATGDGGYIIAGATASYGESNGDVLLLKTNAGGTRIWQKTFGGAALDIGYSVVESAGGYTVLGYTESLGAGQGDVYLIRIDGDGNLLWQKTFGGAKQDGGRSIRVTADGYILGGYTESYGAGIRDVYLLKVNSSGTLLWQKTYGGSNEDHGQCVQVTGDGGYIVTGYTESYGAGGLDLYIVKTDGNGNRLWQNAIGTSGDQAGASVFQTKDGGYLIAGASQRQALKMNIYLVKTDGVGAPSWEALYGSGSWQYALDLQPTSDGGLILGGWVESEFIYTGEDFYLIKLIPQTVEFVRGDSNIDGAVDVSDVCRIFNYYFRGGSLGCRDAGDVTDNGMIDTIADGNMLFQFLFVGGDQPPPPYPEPGLDLTAMDPLDCSQYDPSPPADLADLALGFDGLPESLTGDPGEEKTFDLFATLETSNSLDMEGAEAWSFGLGIENGTIEAVALEGLIVSTVEGPYYEPRMLDLGDALGFAGKATHRDDPLRPGAISAIVLRVFDDIMLSPGGRQRIAKITVRTKIPSEGCSTLALRFEDGFRTDVSQPVANVVSMKGTAQRPSLGSASVTLCARPQGGLQLPGDVNQDLSLDISDGIWILGHLFLGKSTQLPCEGGTATNPGPGDLSLADVNGDGVLDISDSVRVFGFLFLGTKPPALGTECVRIPGCPEGCQQP